MNLSIKRIVIALVVVSLIGCTPIEPNPVNGIKERFDLGKIESLRESMPQIEYVDVSLGYDQEGNLTAWVAITDDRKAYRINGKAYLTTTLKQVLDNTPDIARAWLFTHDNDTTDDGAIAHVTRNSYIKHGLSKISDADSFWVLPSVRRYSNQWFTDSRIEKQCKEFYDKRLLRFHSDFWLSRPTYELRVEGIPQEINKEIAQVYCLLHHLLFPATYASLEVTYVEEGIAKQTTRSAIMIGALETIPYTSVGYDVELFSGGPFPLNINYCVEVLDEDYVLPEEKTTRIPYEYTLKRPNVTYKEIMEELQHYDGISVEHLGYGQDGLTAVLTMKDQDNAELHRRQWEIALTTMETPVNTLWFITESEERIVVSCFDRQRYDILQFIGDKITVSHEDWPILAKFYWEKAK